MKIYGYVAGDDSGYTSSGYGPLKGDQPFFARVSPVVGHELTVAEQADHRERCIFEFSDHVDVSHDDLIVDPDDVQWKVESIAPRRARRAKIVRAVRTADEPVVVPSDTAPPVSGGDGGGADAAFDEFIDGGGADSAF